MSKSDAGESGFTVLELVVAMAILATFVSALAVTIDSSLNLARQNRHRVVAANLASQEMDRVRSTEFDALPLGLVSTPESVDGVNYTVLRETEWIATGATGSACDSSGTSPSYLRVTVDVTWDNMRTVTPVKEATVITPPVGSYDPNSGHISVRVLDRNAQPEGGVPVRVQATGYDETIDTTSEGCAFFAFLDGGTYTVTLTKTGFVDRQSVTSPSQSVGVTVGNTSSVIFDYDEAANILLALQAPDGGEFPNPNSLTITIGNTGLLPSGTKGYIGSGVTRTLANLFPDSAGYELWLGECLDSDPEGQMSGGGPFWPGANRVDASSVTPGSTTNATTDVASVDLNVLLGAASHGPDQLQAVHVDEFGAVGGDAGCPSGETLSFSDTDANGYKRVALPYGNWEIRAVGHSSATAWPRVAVNPLNVGVQSVQVDVT